MSYRPPHINIDEIVNPSVAPLFDTPTTICLVGEAAGYQVGDEILTLLDSDAVILKYTGIDSSTVVVRDANDPTQVYENASDYILTSNGDGTMTIKRKVYTTISNGETVVAVVTTTTPDVDEVIVSLNGNEATGALNIASAGNVSSVSVQKKGIFSGISDYAYASGAVARTGPSSKIVDGQTVYVSYTTASGANAYYNEPHTLTGTSTSALDHDDETVDSGSVVVRNFDDNALVNDVVIYTSTAVTGDYVLVLDGQTFTLQRNVNGPTTIGVAENEGRIRIAYNATSNEYYFATEFFGYSDVEQKYGASFDSAGNINSKVSFGALLAFGNGASSVIIQPLFRASINGDTLSQRLSPRPSTDTSNYLVDWTNTVNALRDFTQINVIVPIVGQGNGLTDDSIISIFQKVTSHINFMFYNGEHAIGLFGEDSTGGTYANAATLRGHGRTLGGGTLPERNALVSPASFTYPNPAGAGTLKIGGQYVAAALAGMLSARDVQQPLTRKTVGGITNVNDYRSEIDKNRDAEAGLLVVEKRNAVVRVRHAITTAVNDTNNRELSVVRAKHYMIESIRNTVEEQIIGSLYADADAPFTVQASIEGVLSSLVADQVIVGYGGVQARSLAPSQPTVIEVRFTYLPAYPLNYVNVVFSIDQTSGAVAVDTTL